MALTDDAAIVEGASGRALQREEMGQTPVRRRNHPLTVVRSPGPSIFEGR
ncbi:MAG TPA: hypothetical protein VNM72_12105 [Blastocatellia bacterium]|nr:hypothetical protein [Blastocatellia bacterium]